MTNKFDKVLANIPTPVLLKAARERNRVERTQHGPYASQKKLTLCPKGCGRSFGVRELRRHKRDCVGPVSKKRKAA